MASEIITGVDFVALPADDFDTSVAFYRDVLGLPCSTLVPERGFAEFETGNLTLGLIIPEKMGITSWVSESVVALHVDDMEQARERLTAAGVSFAGETFDTGVCHMGLFRDPHGNALMLHHRYAPRG